MLTRHAKAYNSSSSVI